MIAFQYVAYYGKVIPLDFPTGNLISEYGFHCQFFSHAAKSFVKPNGFRVAFKYPKKGGFCALS